jgi:hypothetical protein
MREDYYGSRTIALAYLQWKDCSAIAIVNYILFRSMGKSNLPITKHAYTKS